MNIQELRVGNIIEKKFTYNGHSWWDWSFVRADEYATFEEVKHIYRPIELTEEWLVRLGGDKILEGQFVFSNGGNIRIEILFGFYKDRPIVCDINDATVSAEVRYIHQLQNIYYPLMGAELSYLK